MQAYSQEHNREVAAGARERTGEDTPGGMSEPETKSSAGVWPVSKSL